MAASRWGSQVEDVLASLRVRDGTGIVEAVAFKGGLPPETFELAGSVTEESPLGP